MFKIRVLKIQKEVKIQLLRKLTLGGRFVQHAALPHATPTNEHLHSAKCATLLETDYWGDH